ncbi:hypothetical protein NUW54_g13337 [Trametes sanguinea]|uniref:Uncharacterized protein n=1 Tax=Trametes sanguinea TaxID=158606 RepID=A0ACC1MNA6_9APHY|nr:hypothetical protein NUW54_g13337 [Trametes sanguinea]
MFRLRLSQHALNTTNNNDSTACLPVQQAPSSGNACTCKRPGSSLAPRPRPPLCNLNDPPTALPGPWSCRQVVDTQPLQRSGVCSDWLPQRDLQARRRPAAMCGITIF